MSALAELPRPDRLDDVRAAMVDAGVDGLVVGPGAPLVSVLGWSPVTFERVFALFVWEAGETIVCPLLNAGEVRDRLGIDILEWRDQDGPGAAVQAALTRMCNGATAGKRVAVDPELSAASLLTIQAAAASASWEPAEEILGRLRAVKSDADIARLKAAALVADAAIRAAVEACRPGATETDIANVVFQTYRSHGSEPWFAEIGSGPNGALPLHMHSDRVLEQGDVVRLDVGGCTDGFASDVARTIAIGHASDRFREVYGLVERAGRTAMAAVRPGARCGAIDRTARNVIEEAGYGDALLHRTGHGLGRSLHEPPWIVSTNDVTLQEGMVFSIEPGVYLPGEFGVRTEEIVHVTAGGCQRLSELPRELQVVPA